MPCCWHGTNAHDASVHAAIHSFDDGSWNRRSRLDLDELFALLHVSALGVKDRMTKDRMTKDSVLKDALLALASEQKAQYVMVSAISAELTALKETVRGLDPTFAEVLEPRRQAAAEAQADIVQAVIRQFDSILRRIGEIC